MANGRKAGRSPWSSRTPRTRSIAAVVEEDVAFGPENLGLSPEEIRAGVSGPWDVSGLGKDGPETRLRPLGGTEAETWPLRSHRPRSRHAW
jgi:hypothetical protein